MDYDLVDRLLSKAGLRFVWLHDHDYENFCPYEFSRVMIAECVKVISSNKVIGTSEKVELINSIQEHFKVKP